MNEQQTAMAEFILQTLSDNAGCMDKGHLDRMFINQYGETVPARKDRFYVKNQLEEEYKLIRTKGTMLLLSDNGHVAKRIGFHKYVKKMHKNKRLDFKIKQLEFWCKMMDFIQKAPTALISTVETIILEAVI